MQLGLNVDQKLIEREMLRVEGSYVDTIDKFNTPNGNIVRVNIRNIAYDLHLIILELDLLNAMERVFEFYVRREGNVPLFFQGPMLRSESIGYARRIVEVDKNEKMSEFRKDLDNYMSNLIVKK